VSASGSRSCPIASRLFVGESSRKPALTGVDPSCRSKRACFARRHGVQRELRSLRRTCEPAEGATYGRSRPCAEAALHDAPRSVGPPGSGILFGPAVAVVPTSVGRGLRTRSEKSP
jgi:hypothetical protein